MKLSAAVLICWMAGAVTTTAGLGDTGVGVATAQEAYIDAGPLEYEDEDSKMDYFINGEFRPPPHQDVFLDEPENNGEAATRHFAAIDPDASSFQVRRRLDTSPFSIKSARQGTYLKMFWASDDACPVNSLYVYTSKGYTNHRVNGTTTKFAGTNGNVYLDLYTDCTATTATLTKVFVDSTAGNNDDADTVSLVINAKLNSATFKANVSNSSFITQDCYKVCDGRSDDDDDDNSDSDPCEFSNCTIISRDYGMFEISAKWKAIRGATPEIYNTRSFNSGAGYSTLSASKGQTHPARIVALTFSLDGEETEFLNFYDNSGYIYNSSNTDVHKSF